MGCADTFFFCALELANFGKGLIFNQSLEMLVARIFLDCHFVKSPGQNPSQFVLHVFHWGGDEVKRIARPGLACVHLSRLA